MIEWLTAEIPGAVPALAAAATVAVAVGLAVDRRRRRAGTPPRRARAAAVGDALLVLSVAAIVVVTLLPLGGDGGVHLVPGVETWRTVTRRHPATAVRELAGNVALFVPFGLLVARRVPALRSPARAAAAGAALSVAIEAAQLVLDTGRWAQVDDVVLNTAGVALGAVAWRAWRRRRHAGRGVPPARLPCTTVGEGPTPGSRRTEADDTWTR